MHEAALVRDLLRQVEGLMREHSAHRVVSIRLQVGDFSGVESELLQSSFERLAPLSDVRGAELIVERVPLESRCEECGNEFSIRQFRFVCSRCGSDRIEVIRGEELLLDRVTLEQGDDVE